mgnify:CR=1 FL=1
MPIVIWRFRYLYHKVDTLLPISLLTLLISLLTLPNNLPAMLRLRHTLSLADTRLTTRLFEAPHVRLFQQFFYQD